MARNHRLMLLPRVPEYLRSQVLSIALLVVDGDCEDILVIAQVAGCSAEMMLDESDKLGLSYEVCLSNVILE